jgi:hypothetical protein
MSLQHLTYAHHARLSLVQEVSSPSESSASKRVSRYEEPAHSPTLSNPLSTRTNSEPTLYVPIRRRSLLQHGVATRSSYIEPDPRPSQAAQSTPDLRNDPYYYNPSKPTSSPLDNLAMLGPNHDFATPGPRTETPTDFDYRHIGAFKLGSLRITNGAASPVPSLDGRPSTSQDYILSGEVRASTERESRHRHGLSQRSNTLSIPAEKVKAPWISTLRPESPLRHASTSERERPKFDSEDEGEDSEPEMLIEKFIFKPLDLKIDTQLPLLDDPAFKLFDFDATTELFKRTESPTKSLELANEYQEDIALSPFSFDHSPPVTPRFQVTSKHTAVEDELFEPEPESPPLNATADQDIQTRIPRSFDSGYEGDRAELAARAAARAKAPRELAPKPLAKADSGYSSNVSLRSFKKKEERKRETSAIVQPKEMEVLPTTPRDEKLQVPESSYFAESMSSDMRMQERDPLSRVASSTYSTPSAAIGAPNRPEIPSRVASSTYSVSAPSETTAQDRQSLSRVSSSTYSVSSPSEATIQDRQSISRVSSSAYSVASRDPISRVTSISYSVSSPSEEMSVRTKRSLPVLPVEASIPTPAEPFREAPPPPVPAKHASYQATSPIRENFSSNPPATTPQNPMRQSWITPVTTLSQETLTPSPVALEKQRGQSWATPERGSPVTSLAAKHSSYQGTPLSQESFSSSPPVPEKPRQSWVTPEKASLVTALPKHVLHKNVPGSPATPLQTSSPAGSEVSTTSSSSRWRSKPKRPQSFQYQPQPISTSKHPTYVNEIPTPSMEARKHLEERVDAFPVACFPNTIEGSAWSGLRRSSSKETLGTIFSVGSLEVREERNWKERMMEKLPAVPPIERIAEMEVERKPVQTRPKVEDNRRNTYHPAPTQTSPPAPEMVVGRKPVQTRPKLEENRRNTYQPEPAPAPVPTQRYRRKSLQPQQQDLRDSGPPQTQAQRDSEFENNLSSYDNISNSLGRSPYELANTMFSRNNLAKPDVKERAKSMTAQFEAEAAARFAASRQNQNWNQNQRNVSNESTNTVVMHATRSYESIPTYSTPSPSGNMSGYGAGTVEEVIKERRKSRERPPPAHAKFANSPTLRSTPPPRAPSSTPPPRSIFQEPGHISSQILGQEDEVGMRRMSIIGAKTSSKPPVSMTTQRKALPSHATSPSPPERTAPRPPILKAQTETQPAPQKRKPVQTRRSMELPSGPQQYISYPSPSSARQSFDHSLLQQQLKQQQQTKAPTQVQAQVQEQGRFSWQRQQGNGNAIARPASASARPLLDYQNARPHNLRAGVSFDTSQQQNQKLWAGQQPESYDHTYGSSYLPPRRSSTPTRSFQQHQHAPEEEYYDAPRQDWGEREGEERVLKERRTSGSTSEMLRLDIPVAIPTATARASVVSPLPERENQTLRQRKEELKRKERERAMVVRDSGYASPAQGPVGYGYVTGYSPAGRRVQVQVGG